MTTNFTERMTQAKQKMGGKLNEWSKKIDTEKMKSGLGNFKNKAGEQTKEQYTRLKAFTGQQSVIARQKFGELLDKNNPSQYRFTLATLILLIIWLMFISIGGLFSFGAVVTGLVVAVITAWLSSAHLTFLDAIKFSPTMPFHVGRYLLTFLIALFKANIDMARRILSPRLPINPAIVLVKTELKSPLGKLLLANSITLTPGTLTVDVLADSLQIHWVDSSPGEDLVHATEAISQSFEQHIREFIE